MPVTSMMMIHQKKCFPKCSPNFLTLFMSHIYSAGVPAPLLLKSEPGKVPHMVDYRNFLGYHLLNFNLSKLNLLKPFDWSKWSNTCSKTFVNWGVRCRPFTPKAPTDPDEKAKAKSKAKARARQPKGPAAKAEPEESPAPAKGAGREKKRKAPAK